MFLALLGLLPAIILTIVLFLINPILGILAFIWFVAVGVNAWKRHK